MCKKELINHTTGKSTCLCSCKRDNEVHKSISIIKQLSSDFGVHVKGLDEIEKIYNKHSNVYNY